MSTLAATGGMWFHARDKQKHGPFTWEQLRDLVGAGTLQPDDMILEQGAARWLAARDVQGLFSPFPETLIIGSDASPSSKDVPPSLPVATFVPSPRTDSPDAGVITADAELLISAEASFLP